MPRQSRLMVLALVVALLLIPRLGAASGVLLPRKNGGGPGKDEAYPGVIVLYDAIRDAAGRRLRLVATHPDHPAGRYPVIYVVGWLSCDTIEAPPGTTDGTQRMLQALAQTPGFAMVRLEKPGVGDSEGDCAQTDFASELAAYRLAFQHLKDYAFVDPDRIFLFGMSNGGGFAPLVADGTPVRGYVVDGGWIKTWFEHMLEIERRRLTLAGHAPGEINVLMRSVATLYSAYLLDRQPPHEIFAKQPELRKLWEGADAQQYGRPISYYQQLQDLNLMAAWSTVRVPVLALHGEYDWIMSRGDFELLVELINHNKPESAEFVELPRTGHTFEHYASLQSAFDGKQLPFDDAIAQRVRDWFIRHQQ
ncbi:MAG: alpha/beta hydrolase [Gammaproteobacteria bacterium]|nr:alpha/beta hydrolase [Gammaproteobacteria bacterium]